MQVELTKKRKKEGETEKAKAGMDRSEEIGGDADDKGIKNRNQKNTTGGGGTKGKSCKGCMYYSSTLKSNGSNPRCFGIPRTIQPVPNYIVGESEVEASKEGRSLRDFYYVCAGYSVYISKDYSTDKQVTKTQLPVCVGLELLVDRTVATADNASTPAHVHGREDARELPQPTHKPAHSAGDDFLSRYTRNANLVASGVARNMRKVGNYVKESLGDILYPYGRRPK